jgi:hypothetical protein
MYGERTYVQFFEYGMKPAEFNNAVLHILQAFEISDSDS